MQLKLVDLPGTKPGQCFKGLLAVNPATPYVTYTLKRKIGVEKTTALMPAENQLYKGQESKVFSNRQALFIMIGSFFLLGVRGLKVTSRLALLCYLGFVGAGVSFWCLSALKLIYLVFPTWSPLTE